jgi:hypothetical protein
MAQTPVLSFRKEVSLVETLEGRITLESPWGKAILSELTPGLLPVLRSLSSGGATEDDLCSLVLKTEGASALATFYYYLERWRKLGLLCYSLVVDGWPLATVVPMTRGFQFSRPNISVNARFCLSRFAYCRREADALVLESPLSPRKCLLAIFRFSHLIIIGHAQLLALAGELRLDHPSCCTQKTVSLAAGGSAY